MRPRKAIISWALLASVFTMLVANLVLELLLGGDPMGTLAAVLFITAMISTLTVGMVLTLRRPGNSIGWILLLNSAFLAAVGLATSYADYAINAHPGALPAAEWAVAFEDRTWPALLFAVTAVAFVFPDGKVLAERRRAARLTAAAFAALLLAGIFSSDPFAAPFESVDNPIPAIPEPIVSLLFLFGIAGALAGMVQAARSLRTRYRGAAGIERLQMRWLSFAAATIPPVIAICLAESLITGSDGVATLLAIGFALTAIPVAVGIAVMRYRLYEIDRVINRTLVYAALTVALAASFAVVSIAMGVALGGGSTLPTAAATLVVVVIFNPLRGRIQMQVDRRFNRARYDGLRRVERFLAELRSGKASPEAAEATLAEALDDPSLELLYWISAESPYVAADGTPRTLDVGAGRISTPVTRGSLRLGTVVHDGRVVDHPDLLDSVIEAAGLAIEIGRLRVEVRQRLAEVEESRARIVTASIEERRRLERDLHDGAQQRLVSIGLDLRHVQNALGADQRDAHDSLDEVVRELAVAITDLRELARGIRPPALDDGLAAALEQLSSRSSLPIAVDASSDRLDRDIEAAAYFVASEALTNTVKHSGATRASVSASRSNGSLLVTIFDNGVGGASPEGGSGLEGIADRLAALGGSLTIESPPGRGTKVLAELPCE